MAALMLVLQILAALLVFGIIILVHELGHFLMAKWMGVKVNEFAIGMGPKLLKFGKKETVYTLRLIPFGGFCAMEGEDEGAPMPQAVGGNGRNLSTDRTESVENAATGDSPMGDAVESLPSDRSFAKKKVWRRILIVVAGAAMNLVLGFVLLLVYFGVCYPPNSQGEVLFSSTTIAEIHPDSPAYQTGLRPGDRFVKINNKGVTTDRDIAMFMGNDEDGVFDIVVERVQDGKKQKVRLENVTFELREDPETGSRILIYDFAVEDIPRTVWSTIVQSAKMEYTVGTMIWRSLGDIVTGKYGLNDLSGPVGTVDAIGDAVGQVVTQERWQDGLGYLLMLVTLITVNVGIFNLLPLPALDGGRLIFLLIEAVFRKPVPAKYEGMIHAIGMALLLLLMVVVTFSDIFKLFG